MIAAAKPVPLKRPSKRPKEIALPNALRYTACCPTFLAAPAISSGLCLADAAHPLSAAGIRV